MNQAQWRRCVGIWMTVILLLLTIPYHTAHAEGLDYSALEQLNQWQYYFCRTMMSIALKDSYDVKVQTGKNIFPSITCGQACFEGGICGAPISVIGNGHFAVRAYSYFHGMVYDDHEEKLYASYADAINLKGQSYVENTGFWRAYESWDECVYDHTEMLLTQTKYADMIVAKDYKHAAQAYQDAKYMGEKANYKNNLLKRVEGYGFVQLDGVVEDEHGIFGLIMDCSRLSLSIGESKQIYATSYPETSYDCTDQIVWKSLNPDVATVSRDGTVTAVSHGYTLITAVYNGKEACCVVDVDCNAYNMRGSHYVYDAPGGNKIGKIAKGQPVYAYDETVHGYTKVTARVSSGEIVTGYTESQYIYVVKPPEVSIRLSSPLPVMSIGQRETLSLSADIDVSIEWQSSNTDVVTIENNTVYAVGNGAAVLSLYANHKLMLSEPVFVGPTSYRVVYAVKSNDLRKKPVKDKTNNEYGTVRVGEEAILLEENDDWMRVIVYAEGFYYDGYARPDNFVFKPSAQVRNMIIPPVLIVGDVTGDGLLSNEDTVLLREHLLQTNELDATAVKAADTNGDGEITTLDYIVLKRMVVHKQITG